MDLEALLGDAKAETSEHDHGYKLLFSQPLLIEELLRGFLPEAWVRRFDFSTLEKTGGSVITDDLRERHDDVIWRLRWNRFPRRSVNASKISPHRS